MQRKKKSLCYLLVLTTCSKFATSVLLEGNKEENSITRRTRIDCIFEQPLPGNEQSNALLNSTSVATGWEGSLGKWIHVYVRLNPFAVHLKLSQHC